MCLWRVLYVSRKYLFLLCIEGVTDRIYIDQVWAIAQERLSVPFQSIDGKSFDKFKSPLFMGTCQSAMSSLSALIYILIRRKSGEPLQQTLGLSHADATKHDSKPANGSANGDSNGHARPRRDSKASNDSARFSRRALLLRYLQCSFFITSAAPFGFAALSYISYPAMVLGKSCKLVPVMLMNVLLYRRRFARYKYLVVFMVTAGITVFMYFGGEKKKSKSHSTSSITNTGPYASSIGLGYLLINLALDGATNSTQDEIFARHRVTGQQMMLFINLFCTLLTSFLSVLPLPYIPVIHPSESGTTELAGALEFVRTHPNIITPLVQYSLTGALGQLFIFETLQHFGSLTLVTITLTRKMFTMLLSVVVYNHKLTVGQWLGTGIVFAGISVEAYVKRRDVHAKRVIQEKEKAKIKSL
ncbi:hypothetical protein HGRIS_005842 [Hohenbuehelia grisea]|uniref:UDP-galactose transporter homolog 1 n=1 Tax=Hohenbuehelia grisea TaxID=104357 RepID=A0ABR3K0B5_9AGAR